MYVDCEVKSLTLNPSPKERDFFMIKKSEIFPVGQITKTHGLKGELAFNADDSFPYAVEITFVILKAEGIFVPFYIESIRFKSDSAGFIKLEGIDTEEQARELTGLEIYLPNEFLDELTHNEVHINYFIGFDLVDEKLGKIGTVTDIDDSTKNILFVVQGINDEFLVPVTEDYITEIDEEHKTLKMDLPEGLLDI